ncbi:hypothetical protein EXN57_12145 [Clostridium botulinum]|nr:hypothetical protein [Clostridium botulinum]NFD34719.1 hypothetical protein [Clostridium botulinum]NFD61169.1 hypothetical protein [Clostridium botulinum]NFE02042.1 hypothetical protein [Clostridium botulinum]
MLSNYEKINLKIIQLFRKTQSSYNLTELLFTIGGIL